MLGLSLLLFSSRALSDSYFSTEYDCYFKKYSDAYFMHYDWKWLKAQGIQESLLDPTARSYAGALGIMQIMPGTWEEETREMGIIASPFNPRVNIAVGAHYMRKMERFWKAPRSREERLKLAQASYNAGAGSILRAQDKCGGSHWAMIRICLSQVTGRANSQQTIKYVARIAGWYVRLQ